MNTVISVHVYLLLGVNKHLSLPLEGLAALDHWGTLGRGNSAVGSCKGLIAESIELASGVNSEDHALSAVTLLLAVEPCWLGGRDGVVDDELAADVLGVELVQAGVETAVEGAGLVEARLGERVGELEEVELDEVSDCGVNLVGAVDQFALVTDSDKVGSVGSSGGGGCRGGLGLRWWWRSICISRGIGLSHRNGLGLGVYDRGSDVDDLGGDDLIILVDNHCDIMACPCGFLGWVDVDGGARTGVVTR